jgi:hypothetical protein
LLVALFSFQYLSLQISVNNSRAVIEQKLLLFSFQCAVTELFLLVYYFISLH